jgi:ABC-type lipoprotein release transport system permease subunit
MLSVMAVIPAVIISAGILGGLGRLSGLSTGLGLDDILLISLISLAMCSASAVLALGKVRRLEPAELI